MVKNIVVIEGDGIGPEVTGNQYVHQFVAMKFSHEFNYNYCLMGAMLLIRQEILCLIKQ